MTTTTKNSTSLFNLNKYNLLISGAFIFISLIATWFLSSIDQQFAAIWLLSNVAGFVLQRSRFCFASGFRDLFLFGSGANMKGIIVGLIVSSIGFTAIMHWITAIPALGGIPSEENVGRIFNTTLLE